MNSIIFLLLITFTNESGNIGVAWDKNPHATKQSCEAKVDHLRPTAPKNWQYVEYECKAYPAPQYPVNGDSSLTPNT